MGGSSYPNSKRTPTSRLANATAQAICQAFDQSQLRFREITRRAAKRFDQRDWHAMHSDSAARLDVYEMAVDRIVARVRELLDDRLRSRLAWVSIKAVYSGLIHDRDDLEIAETFFNSITRRIFDTVGVDEEIEFVHTDYESPPSRPKRPAYRTLDVSVSLAQGIEGWLAASCPPLGDQEVQRQAMVASSCIQRQLGQLDSQAAIDHIEILDSVFYRGDFACLIGRIRCARRVVPLVLCLQHTEEGVLVDAVLMDESDVSLLFSFARSYFHVDTDRPFDIVQFIKTIIPRKPRSEIYNSIGYKSHGKTELYRHALRHLDGSSDKYQFARGQRGMVMAVFSMPSYPVVFKIIKDKFDYPKQTTRQAVIDCYRLVFKHDRAGRLIDAQEYMYLTLDRRRFDDKLLDELLRVASQTVFVEGDRVVIKHCYAERRVTPLVVYFQEADEQAAREAVIDYGQTIKDLAFTNIFPGDLMLKNFGVTRQRRLVFYDYDEVCLLTDCTFRRLPEPKDYDDLMAAEPYFAVGKYDVFPEEFGYFLGLPPPLRSVFMEHHADLLTVEYWLEVQQKLIDGGLFDIAPYGEERRVREPSCTPHRTSS